MPLEPVPPRGGGEVEVDGDRLGADLHSDLLGVGGALEKDGPGMPDVHLGVRETRHSLGDNGLDHHPHPRLFVHREVREAPPEVGEDRRLHHLDEVDALDLEPHGQDLHLDIIGRRAVLRVHGGGLDHEAPLLGGGGLRGHWDFGDLPLEAEVSVATRRGAWDGLDQIPVPVDLDAHHGPAHGFVVEGEVPR